VSERGAAPAKDLGKRPGGLVYGANGTLGANRVAHGLDLGSGEQLCLAPGEGSSVSREWETDAPLVL